MLRIRYSLPFVSLLSFFGIFTPAFECWGFSKPDQAWFNSSVPREEIPHGSPIRGESGVFRGIPSPSVGERAGLSGRFVAGEGSLSRGGQGSFRMLPGFSEGGRIGRGSSQEVVIRRERLPLLQGGVVTSPVVEERAATPREHSDFPESRGGEGRVAGLSHIVRSGETLYSLSRRYGVSVRRLLSYNSLPSAEALLAGQRLTIPIEGKKAVPIRIPVSSPPLVEKEKVGRSDADSTIRPSVPPAFVRGHVDVVPMLRPSLFSEENKMHLPVQGVKSVSLPSSESLEIPSPIREESRMSGRFRWPVQGRILSKFGTLSGGIKNDGINIAVPEGALIKAAGGGVVAYAGDEIRGYGQLILIRHRAGWVTAYAHNSEMLVRRGERVRRGQVIARAGRTGNVEQPQLHFEVRRGSRPVDPIPLFSSG